MDFSEPEWAVALNKAANGHAVLGWTAVGLRGWSGRACLLTQHRPPQPHPEAPKVIFSSKLET